MAEQYSNVFILYKIIDYKFTFVDLNPKRYPVLQHNLALYCDWHESSRTGTKHARMYYDEDTDLWHIHCYVEKTNYYAHDYVEQIMIKERKLFRNLKEFILSKMSKEEFISLYNLYKSKVKEELDTKYKNKCEWIDNVYADTGNTLDYIETLYTA